MLGTEKAITVTNPDFGPVTAKGYELPGFDDATFIEFCDTRDERKLIAAVVHLPHQLITPDHGNWSGYPVATPGGSLEVTFFFSISTGVKYLFASITNRSQDGVIETRMHGLGPY